MRRTWAAAILFALLSFCLPAAADPMPRDALMNERLTVPADGLTHAFRFVPTANNLYTVRCFGAGDAQLSLYLEGEAAPLAQGGFTGVTSRLIAGRTYRLEVTAQGAAAEVEIMRDALGRCFDQPIELDVDTGYDKAVARAYDTHWYRFTAKDSGLYALYTASDLNTVGYLLAEDGSRLATNDNLYAPYELDFRIQYPLTAGKTYLLRVSGRGEETGAYHLRVLRQTPGAAIPQALTLSPQAVELREGESAQLTAALAPENAMPGVMYLSADPDVAVVDETGVVTAKAAGRTQIICVGAGDAQARADVTVAAIPVTGLALPASDMSLRQGDAWTLTPEIQPANASNKAVRLESSDETVVKVRAENLIEAVGVGEAIVTVTTRDGGFAAQLAVTVDRARPVYRVLALGEQRYEDGRVRVGCINTTQGVSDLFRNQAYGAEVTTRLDSTRAEAITAIRKTFRDALPTDISIFYINCHGGVAGGEPWLLFHDGTRLTGEQLERELRKIPGIVVLLVDCCNSGSFISQKDARDFAGRMRQIFSPGDDSRFLSSKYRILVSAGSSQDSYRIGYGEAIENNRATVFSWSLCEAGGWDLMGDKAMRLRADDDQSRKVTFSEAARYVEKRVRQYLSGTGKRQDVQVSGEDSTLVLFEK